MDNQVKISEFLFIKIKKYDELIKLHYFQFIYFKEHLKLNLFGDKNESRLDISSRSQVKLLAVSNLYGFVAAGYKNCNFSR
jgi:hypothetical protein